MADDAAPLEPVSLDEAKAQLRVTSGAEDALIAGLIVAAREDVEAYTSLILTEREVVEPIRALDNYIDLASWPVTGVTAINYLDAAGVERPIDLSTVSIAYRYRPVRIRPLRYGWGVALPIGFGPLASAGPVTVTMQAGFAAADVPQTVKQAMLLMITHWYQNRSAVEAGDRAAGIELPFTIKRLLGRLRPATI